MYVSLWEIHHCTGRYDWKFYLQIPIVFVQWVRRSFHPMAQFSRNLCFQSRNWIIRRHHWIWYLPLPLEVQQGCNRRPEIYWIQRHHRWFDFIRCEIAIQDVEFCGVNIRCNGRLGIFKIFDSLFIVFRIKSCVWFYIAHTTEMIEKFITVRHVYVHSARIFFIKNLPYFLSFPFQRFVNTFATFFSESSLFFFYFKDLYSPHVFVSAPICASVVARSPALAASVRLSRHSRSYQAGLTPCRFWTLICISTNVRSHAWHI